MTAWILAGAALCVYFGVGFIVTIAYLLSSDDVELRERAELAAALFLFWPLLLEI